MQVTPKFEGSRFISGDFSLQRRFNFHWSDETDQQIEATVNNLKIKAQNSFAPGPTPEIDESAARLLNRIRSHKNVHAVLQLRTSQTVQLSKELEHRNPLIEPAQGKERLLELLNVLDAVNNNLHADDELVGPDGEVPNVPHYSDDSNRNNAIDWAARVGVVDVLKLEEGSISAPETPVDH